MTPSDIIEEITTHCQRAIERALPADLPGRLLILPVPEHESSWGLAVGDGRLAAQANGGGALDRAIRVNAGAIVGHHRSHEEDVAACLAVACHEVAHLLVSAPDRAATTAEAVAFWNEILATTPTGGAGLHAPNWAGSFFAIVDRLRGVLPLAAHRRLVRHSWSGLRRYGFRPLEILDALDGLSLPESVAATFAPGAGAALALVAACDDALTRQAWIDRSTRKALATSASAA